MKIKFYTALFCLLLVSLLLGACAAPSAPNSTNNNMNSSDDTPSEPGQAAEEPVTLDFWIYSDYATGPALEMQNTFISEFEAANPNIKINLISKPGTDIGAGLIAGAVSGEMPDVFVHGLGDTPTYSTLNILENLTPMFEAMPESYKNQFIPEVLEKAKSDGNLYGLPYTGYSTMLYRNLKVLKDAGIDPDAGITDWEDWMNQMQKVNANGAASIPVLTINWWPVEGIYAGQKDSMTGFDEQGNSNLDVDKLADTISFILEAQELGTQVGIFDQGAVDLFISNQLAFFPGGPWSDVTFRAAVDESGLEYDKILIPGVSAEEHGGVKGYEYIGITTGPNVDAAWKWATYLTDVEQQVRWSSTLGRYVPNQEALDSPTVKENALVQLTADSAQNAVFDYPPYFKPMPPDWMAQVNDILGGAASGIYTPQEAAQKIVDDLTTMYNNK